MCDSDKGKAGTGWRGWPELPAQRRRVPLGDWIDLTWPLSTTVPRIASFPPPRSERVESIPDKPLNITELQMIVHIGTDVDSPQVTNVKSLTGRRTEFMFCPLDIIDCDGSPARVLARAITD